jgi:protein AFG1
MFIHTLSGKACMFSFSDLCSKAVAAADYLALAEAYHTVALRGVPCFKAANRTDGYRFVTLVDVMYEHR